MTLQVDEVRAEVAAYYVMAAGPRMRLTMHLRWHDPDGRRIETRMELLLSAPEARRLARALAPAWDPAGDAPEEQG